MTTAEKRREIKCVVWDLDDTLWEGVLLEGGRAELRPGILNILRTLDSRGILLSIASRNDPAAAMKRLSDLGVAELFLYPRIGWGSKAASIADIQKALNIGMNSIAFVDDQPFERAEVSFAHADVLCIDPADLDGFLDRPEVNPRFITEDSKRRRAMYAMDLERTAAESAFIGPSEEFLATLAMKFIISRARETDLQRAEELTIRTNQLNATGKSYSYEQLSSILASTTHDLWIAELTDRFGSYGKIGLALVERRADLHWLRLLLTSCRVMSRGVGTILLQYVMREARDAKCRLLADFVDTGKNRMMLVTYRFAGFREVDRSGEVATLESTLERIPEDPRSIDIHIDRA